MLQSWTDGPTKSAIVEFVQRTVDDVPPEDRIAVFDNDGTLWCEKPAYIQLDFLVRRMAEQARADPALADRQPYQAAATGDLKWFGDAVTKHYNGDDSELKVLAGGILSAFAGLTVEEHAERVKSFFASARHPTLDRPYTACGYTPMIELLRYLQDNGFTTYIASGGGRDFMRPVTPAMYGIPPERVIGSSVGLDFVDGDLRTTNRPEFLDDGPVKRADLGPYGASPDLRCRQFERRYRDAGVHPRPTTAGAARRRRARIRLHRRRGEGFGPGRERRLDRRQHEERLDDDLR